VQFTRGLSVLLLHRLSGGIGESVSHHDATSEARSSIE
jgi:hypothetical protein